MFFVSLFFPMALLAIIAYALWHKKPAFQQEYREEVAGLPDLLRYARPVNERVVQLKNGELLAGIRYRGVDLDSATNHEIMAMMGKLNSILCGFGSGWMMHVDSVRKYALNYQSGTDFPHPVFRLMNEEREAQFRAEGTHFESDFAVMLTWLPPTVAEARAHSMIYESSDSNVVTERDLGAKSLLYFEEKVGRFEAVMKSMLHDVRRMERGPWIEDNVGNAHAVDDLISYIAFCVSGNDKGIRISRNTKTDLDYLVGSHSFVGGNAPKVGDMHIRVVTIEGVPTEASPLIMDVLNRIQVRYRWSTRWIFQDTQKAKGRIEKIKKKWKQKERPMMDDVLGRESGNIDLDAAKMAADAVVAMSELESGDVKPGDYTSVVVLMDESESEVIESAKMVAQLITDLHFPARVEDANSVEAYLGSLPGHGYENVRELPMHSMNLAYLFPATATWSGVPRHPCKWYPEPRSPLFQANAHGSTPFNGVMHFDDVGHAFVVGGTGGGKSTLAQFLIKRQFQYKDAAVFVFEKGYSGAVMCDAVNGRHYDIGNDEWKNAGFAPLGETNTVQGRKWAEEYVEVLFELQGRTLNPKNRQSVKEALKKLGSETEKRTMTKFVSYLDDAELRDILDFYTVNGENYFIDETPENEDVGFSRLTVFEMEHLMEMGPKYVVPILLYLFRKIERSLKGKPTLIVLDEAWLMLSHPLFKERIKVWLKTLRKANTSVWFFTQELAELANSEIRDAIYTSCPTRILLPNPDAVSSSMKPLYVELGLNDQQIELIANAQRKRDYYYVSPYGKRMFQLELGRLNLAFVGVSGKEEVAEARALKKDLGDRAWQIEWVRRRAGRDWARALELLYDKEATNDSEISGNRHARMRA